MRFADLGDVRLAYDVVGAGPTVVLLHGAYVDRRMWAPQVEFLRERFRVVTLDLRGHGATGPTPAERYTIGLFAADVDALLGRLGVERAILCGLSMGGMVAQVLAAARPERFPALVLADTVRHSAPTRWNRLVRDVFFPREVLWPALRWTGMRRATALIFKTVELFDGGAGRGRTGEVRAYARACLRAMAADEVAKVFEAFYHFEGVDYSRLTMPTLVLYGEDDADDIREQCLALTGRIPGAAACEAIPGAGHTPSLENPPAFNAALARFFAVSD